MASSWEESYLGQIRTLAGDERTLIVIGARNIVRDDQGRVLLIKRSDNGFWAFPAGTMELGESISECAVREVFEETGLNARAVTLVGIYSNVEHVGTPNMFGHKYQFITVVFRVDAYDGELVRVTDETTDAAFYRPEDLPEPLSDSIRRTLDDLEAFEKTGVARAD
ncbi:MAG TPA: NUDIX domain-containing protein [Micromonosporaceae bacterium]|jgi:ADP-ribose pyrophosphatase YjhB (NUDIX family)